MVALNLFIFVCSGLQRPKCISSHPVDIDVLFFFTHQTIECIDITFLPEQPSSSWLSGKRSAAWLDLIGETAKMRLKWII